MTKEEIIKDLRNGLPYSKLLDEAATFIEQQAERLAELEPLVGSPACQQFFELKEKVEQQAREIEGMKKADHDEVFELQGEVATLKSMLERCLPFLNQCENPNLPMAEVLKEAQSLLEPPR